ncbi:uncharacterized protein JN550_005803 [Neoarthrinium moseri]|uniref:uncharacterized protein n=1 Tax=Neoarthrinium moseri TaxID=1658444 RepID=UPI001FDDDBF3|nr:uncharacterized protein JN550_005803 [Neoarthrinium moseri]KAI1869173.1 hypothetical protein JN550_005803 [Neoarthrinium moseri]
MASDTLAASLGFLTDAAHLLSATAPEASAHLMSRRNALMFENDLPLPEKQRQHACGCCGHILVPGKGDTLKLEAANAARKQQKPSPGQGTKAQPRKQQQAPSVTGTHKILTCSRCGRYTKMPVPAAPRVSRVRPKRRRVPTEVAAPVFPPPLLNPEPTKASANASSKKRAKNRKQGLQALLQQSQSSSPKMGLGLSLTDFMKKS